MILRLDDLNLIIKLVSLGILLILSALFSAAEALLARLTRDDILKFAEEGGKRYELLTSLLRNPRRYSLTIITAKTILIVVSVIVFMTFWKDQHLVYPVANAALAVACFVILTELFPKNYVQGSTGEATIRALSVLRVIYWGGFVVLIPLNFLANLIVRVFGGKVTLSPRQPRIPRGFRDTRQRRR